MTTGQDQPVPFCCPRCGGSMYKPAGSAFYWHADNSHPRCEITNVPDAPKTLSLTDGATEKSVQGQQHGTSI